MKFRFERIYQRAGVRAFSVATVLGVCSIGSAAADVVSSIKPVGMLAQAMATGVTDARVLLPDGASPHHYALKPSDMRHLTEADLVFWVGPELERFLVKPLARIEGRAVNLMGEEMIEPGHHDEEHDHDEDDHHDEHDHHGDAHDHDGQDVHPWLDPGKAVAMAQRMHAALVDQYPQQREQLDANLEQLKTEIAQAEVEIEALLQPVHQRGFFVFHDAYSGFVEHFGLNQLGYFTIDPSRKPGARHLAEIRDELESQRAACVMTEPQFSSDIVQTLTEGLAVKQAEVDPLGAGTEMSAHAYAEYLRDLGRRFADCLTP